MNYDRKKEAQFFSSWARTPGAHIVFDDRAALTPRETPAEHDGRLDGGPELGGNTLVETDRRHDEEGLRVSAASCSFLPASSGVRLPGKSSALLAMQANYRV